MTILQTNLPASSILNADDKKYDFIDSYKGVLIDKNNTINAQKVGKAFFTSSPKWVSKLFILRNRMVTLLGLKTSGKITDRQTQLDNFKCEKGEQLGLFKVFDRTDKEVIIGEDDKHLNFRVSLFLEGIMGETENKNLIISTTVVLNNSLGKRYFMIVKPFHKFIVPTMLKAIIRNLENK